MKPSLLLCLCAFLATTLLTGCGDNPSQPAHSSSATLGSALEHTQQILAQQREEQRQIETAQQAATPETANAEVEVTAATTPAVEEDSAAMESDSLCSGTPTPEATSIERIALSNAFGIVRFDHLQHASMMGCATCHGEGAPGKIEKSKKEYHALCRTCHVRVEAGPTKCRACHER